MIIIGTQCFPPAIGGIEQLMASLADGFVATGKDVTVLADGKRTSWDTQQPYAIMRSSGAKPWRRWRKKRQLKKLLKQHPQASLLTDSWKSATYLAPLAHHSVCVAHGNDVLTHDNPKRKARIQAALSQVNNIVAVSNYTKTLVQALTTQPVTVIGNPTPEGPEVCPATKTAYQQRYGHLCPLLLTVARLEPRKGHDQVIAALSTLRQQFPNIGYLIAGDGADRERLMQLVEAHRLQDCVHFLGPVNDADKHALYALADCFVMPVRNDTTGRSVEGFGISYLEAASHGLPSLAGNAGGACEAVIDSQTGVCCDGEDARAVADALQTLLNDPEQLRKLGPQAQLRAQTHNHLEFITNSYLAIIKPASPS